MECTKQKNTLRMKGKCIIVNNIEQHNLFVKRNIRQKQN